MRTRVRSADRIPTYLRVNPNSTLADIADALGLPYDTARSTLTTLIRSNIVRKIGHGPLSSSLFSIHESSTETARISVS